jgi:hypothetical protein
MAHSGLELAKRLLYPRAMRKQRRAAAELGSPATQLLATAVRFRQAGQWVAAEACYRQVLAAQPNLAEALATSEVHWLFNASSTRRSPRRGPRRCITDNFLQRASSVGPGNSSELRLLSQ